MRRVLMVMAVCLLVAGCATAAASKQTYKQQAVAAVKVAEAERQQALAAVIAKVRDSGPVVNGMRPEIIVWKWMPSNPDSPRWRELRNWARGLAKWYRRVQADPTLPWQTLD